MLNQNVSRIGRTGSKLAIAVVAVLVVSAGLEAAEPMIQSQYTAIKYEGRVTRDLSHQGGDLFFEVGTAVKGYSVFNHTASPSPFSWNWPLWDSLFPGENVHGATFDTTGFYGSTFVLPGDDTRLVRPFATTPVRITQGKGPIKVSPSPGLWIRESSYFVGDPNVAIVYDEHIKRDLQPSVLGIFESGAVSRTLNTHYTSFDPGHLLTTEELVSHLNNSDSNRLYDPLSVNATPLTVHDIIDRSVTVKQLRALPSGEVTNDSQGPTIYANFHPMQGDMMLEHAAALLGYDHFNWIQYVTHDPYPPSWAGPGTYLDPPPIGDKVNGRYVDDLPFYLNEIPAPDFSNQEHYLGNHTSAFELDFEDTPRDSRLQSGEYMGFYTGLVGVRSDDSFDILWDMTWYSNFNTHDGQVWRYGVLAEDEAELGTGGVFDVVIGNRLSDANPELISRLVADGWSGVYAVPESSSITLASLGFVGIVLGAMVQRASKRSRGNRSVSMPYHLASNVIISDSILS